MTPLILVLIVAALFAAVLTYESGSNDAKLQFRPAGLLTWLTTGNWPAKVGAGLMIIGIGALLRYAFENIQAPPEMKLGSGVIAAALLGFGSMMLKSRPQRRAIHLALAGAAFGVAYLTAYSAYGFFNYITDVNALSLLALVAVAAGVFAIQSNVMSVAILAMVGAYIAPKFALGTPGVLPVYGYYLAASVLSLIMVTLRGWRPLIHLSFLFTLAGAMFFAWDGKFYEPHHYGIMQPLLIALTAVHLAMPLLENKFTRSARFIQFDIAYFTMLPLVAAGLTLKIAPDVHTEGAIGLGALALLWALAAGILYARKNPESNRHALVAAVLAIAAALSYFHDVPWLLAGLALSVIALAIASRQEGLRRVEEIACGAATVFGSLYIIQSVTSLTPAHAFLNELFSYRLIAGILMIAAARIGIRRQIGFAITLHTIGAIWMLLACAAELARLDIDYLPQLSYGIVLGALTLYIWLGDRVPGTAIVGGLLIFATIGTGWWAAPDASNYVALAYMVITAAVLLGLARSSRSASEQGSGDFSPTIAIGLLPFALLPWAFSTAEFVGTNADFYELTIAMIGIAAAGLAGRYWQNASPRWNDRIQPLHVYFTAAALLWVTLFNIERGILPIAFEILALGYLIAYVSRRTREQSSVSLAIGAATVLSVALVLQAMLLRGFGPDQAIMTAADINKMHLPAVVSLMWVIFGSGMAWWGTSTKDRSLWSVGAGLLVVAAIKLVLFDFGTLGQLGNIIAFIVAGMVFMGVAWFAPIPPKAERIPDPIQVPEPAPSTAGEPSSPPAAEKYVPGQRFDQGTRPTGGSSVDGSQPKAGVYIRAKEPESTNWLWFLICGIAIAIALFYSSQHKRASLYKAQEQARRAAEAQRAARPQPAMPPQPVMAPPDSMSSTQPVSAPSAPPLPLPTGTRRASAQGEMERAPPVTSSLPAQPAERMDACLKFAGKLPSDFVVYAAGGYSGRQLSYQIDQSGHTATQIDVDVNQPGKSVVLMLGAYEPTIWNINLSPETKVLAVLISGYHKQVVSGGLNQNIMQLTSTYDNRGPCEYFYVTKDKLEELNRLARRIFGRPVDTVYPAIDGRAVIGAAMPANTRIKASSGASAEPFRDDSAQLAGKAALEEAVFKGLLRKATAADAEAWSSALIQTLAQPAARKADPPKPEMRDAYVVLAEYTYPAGLFGAQSATFLIPKGVPQPQGNPGHSTVYDFNRMLRCKANSCVRPL
ncbi:MAG: DUF2339 domain-containing protein [Rhodocyclales bacterium]|nr:DUF2339 domain-containing protein [Rhodocyclales bacterium]